ncbi:Predicted NTP pyrophosphohydrolase [Chlamydia trachomatis]|nr:Predicted NTP pyrophosphohydrolase [Chlamydia trachomatis]
MEQLQNYNNPNLPVKSQTAREGRENQRYNSETGARIVAGCMCLNETKDKIIMISSSKHKNRWIVPKGGNELDESELETAVRETWEEAGVEGIIIKKLPVVLDSRGSQAPVIKGEFDPDVATPKSEFHFFELQVDQLSTSWPEMKKRQRRWCTYSEAKHELLKLKRPELVDALNMSSILKDTIDDENPKQDNY